MSEVSHRPGQETFIKASASLYPHPSSHFRPADNDYVALHSKSETDALTYFLKTCCSWFFRSHGANAHSRMEAQTLTHANIDQLRSYSFDMVDFTAYFISTILAACLLFVPIYSLYHVSKSKPGTIMGLIAMFTILFAGTIALVTNARRGEIFGATAAYAAVLVVFVSGDFASKAS